MAYDADLAARVRELLAGERQVAEKAMFGRRMFMLQGKLAVGVAGDELMVRVGVDARHDALSQPQTRECDMAQRPMYDWVLIGPDGVRTEAQLEAWVGRGVVFARQLAGAA